MGLLLLLLLALLGRGGALLALLLALLLLRAFRRQRSGGRAPGNLTGVAASTLHPERALCGLWSAEGSRDRRRGAGITEAVAAGRQGHNIGRCRTPKSAEVAEDRSAGGEARDSRAIRREREAHGPAIGMGAVVGGARDVIRCRRRGRRQSRWQGQGQDQPSRSVSSHLACVCGGCHFIPRSPLQPNRVGGIIATPVVGNGLVWVVQRARARLRA